MVGTSERRKINIKVLFIALLLCFSAYFVVAAEGRDVLIERAKHLGWEKKYDEAEVIYQQLLDKIPKDVQAALDLLR